MERSVGSGGVLKKKSSSGCLIIKKKGDFGSNSGGGFGGGSGGSKEKKRAKLAASVSGSSDDNESLEFMRRKVNDKRQHVGNSEYRRTNAGIEIGGERKRSRLDLFEFDEYDEFDGKKMRGGYMDDGFRMAGHSGGGGSSGRNLGGDKWKQAPGFDGSSGGRNKGADHSGSRGYDLEDDESHLPISLLKLKYQDKSNHAIRLQGKNGVLKVMVNKKKNIDYPSMNKSKNPRVEERRGSGSERVSIKEERVPVYRDSKPPENLDLNVSKSKNVDKDKKEVKSEKTKPTSSKVHKPRDLEIKSTDVATKSVPEVVKREAERSPAPEVTPIKQKGVKDSKPKHGGSTEKQMLREKIREMLIDAGWTIDYRPRRNRDYLDAVYINTSGTAYWSIIKAYEAFKKQSGEDGGKSKVDVSSSSPASLPDSLIHKLTRRTKKKIEEETKRKRKEVSLAKNTKKSEVRESSESSDSDQKTRQQDHKSRTRDMHEGNGESEDDLADHQPKRKVRKVKGEKTSLASDSTMLQSRTSKIIGRCTLLVRGSEKGKELESDGYVPYTGKRTLLGWLIDSGTAQLSEKLQYMNRKRTRVMLEGWITREGIHCGCCSKILTVSKFELHAGSKLRQPFQHIFLESGASLLQCQIDAWNKQDEPMREDFHSVDVDGDDPDDDTCGICGDGGDLICCDSCPSTFHQTCLGIQMLPSGDWHCLNCSCKFCGDAGNASEENDSPVNELIKCSVCESKYHISCSEDVSALPKTSNGTSFCGLKCQELYDHLQKILGVKHELEAGFSWSLIQRTDLSDASHRLYNQRVECNSKLAVALSVMDECFMPIFDRRSGINMIHNVVYNCGSNFNRLNYRGFYTAILERGDELIAAACIRIHGTRLAEMPFIGTREIYRRQGMCRRLLCAIEAELCSLKIEHLVIPAIPEHMKTWTGVFGFHELGHELKKEIKSMNMLVFPGTDMLQKPLVKQETSDVVGVTVCESDKDQLHLPRKSDIESSTVHNGQVSSDSGGCPDTKNNDESDAPVSSSAIPAYRSDDNTADTKTKHDSDALVSTSAVAAFPSNDDKADTKPNHESDAPVPSSVMPLLPSVDNNENTKTNDEADSPVSSSAIPSLPSDDNKADTMTNGESHAPVSGSKTPVSHSDNIEADTKMGDESDAPDLPCDYNADTKIKGDSDAPVSGSATPVFHSDDFGADTKTGVESDTQVSSSKIPAFPTEADTKTVDESDAPGSSPVIPAFHSDDNRADCASDAICESDISLVSEQAILVNSEFEKPICSSKDNKKSVEVVLGDACKFESPPLSRCTSSGIIGDASEVIEKQKLSALDKAEIANVQAKEDSPVTVSEGTATESILNNTSVKSSSDATDEVKPVQVVNTEALVQLEPEVNEPTLPVRESEVHLPVEASPDSGRDSYNATASCMKVNGELSPGSAPIISVNDVQTLDENENHAPVSTVSDGEYIMIGGARIDDDVKDELVSESIEKTAGLAGEPDNVRDEPVISGFVQESADTEKPDYVRDEPVASGLVQEAADTEKPDNVTDEPVASGFVQEAADAEKPDDVKDGHVATGLVQEFADAEKHDSMRDEPGVSVFIKEAADAEKPDKVKDEPVASGFVQEAADTEKPDNVRDEPVVSGFVQETVDAEKPDNVRDEPVVSGFVQETADADKPDNVRDESVASGFVQEVAIPAASETPDGKVAPPNHTEEVLAQSEAINESHKDQSSETATDTLV